jgi:hypothetical protein
VRLEVALSTLLPVLGCTGVPNADDTEPDAQAHTRAIVLGIDDSVEVQADGVNIPDVLAAQMDAVGRGQGLGCTGTHIGDRRVLTAGHCVTASSHEHCAATSFEWNVRGDPLHPLVGRCVRVLFVAFSDEADLALVEVDRAPAVAARVDACRDAALGEEVSLLGYPERGPLRWPGYCPLVTDVSEHVMQSIGHRCDTKDGSSGSPLFHRQSGAVVGVHLGVGGADFNRAIAIAAHADDLGLACDATRSRPRGPAHEALYR